MHRKSHGWRRTAFVSATILLTTLAQALPVQAAPYKPGKPQEEPKVVGYSVKPTVWKAASTGKPFQPADPVWPGRTSVDVALPTAAMRANGSDSLVKAGALPVSVSSNGLANVRVQSYDRAQTAAAGVQGLLMRLSRTDAVPAKESVGLSVDYTGFRHAYGGDWSARLRLVVLPECALTAPTAPGCAAKPVPSVNNAKKGTVTATVDVTAVFTTSAPVSGPMADHEPLRSQTSGGLLVALSAAPEGSTGDFKATSLSPSATWNAGGNTGDFGWSYPLRVPPALGGPAPTISFAYSSSSVDGRMASANNQPSIIGEGFEWHPGHLERRYNSCSEDMGSGANNTVKTGDQCWETDNASISLSGHAGELIKDATNGNRWHLRNDDGTFVERRTGASNGDNDGEWWVATTTDGTQYWFGGRSGANSTLVSTVYGNHSNEPCHQATFAASSCNQGYRWQLDHVVDLNGNTMSFTYAKETNKYGKNNSTTDLVDYDRAGYLTKIEYGTRTGSAGNAPVVVELTVADRCFTACSDKQNWPDVPSDQECTASPCDDHSPTFWTRKRLSTIKTRVWNAGTAGYDDVEQWTLSHSFPDPTDSITPALFLDKISHTGLRGGSKSIPDIIFVGQYRPNRVDLAGDQYPAMNRFRIKTIISEAGGRLDVTYSAPDCIAGSRMPDQANLQSNALRCYPVKWNPPGHTAPINDFFHKYLVTDVVEADIFGSSTRVVNHYDYIGDPAWHYTDDDGFIKADYKTWSVWRGYGAVKTIKGDPGEQTLEERRYFRGMHGDKLPSGTRTVTMPAIAVGNIPAMNDEDAFSGQVRETITYNGPAGAEVSASVNEPWQSAPTATRTINGTTVNARFVNTVATHTRTILDKGRPAATSTQTTLFDAYGMPIRMEDQGDDAAANDENCTLIDYVRNTSAWILDRKARERKFAVDCTKAQGTGLTDDDVVSDTKSSYDGAAWSTGESTTLPSKALVTQVDTLRAYNAGSPTYQVEGRNVYDTHGRVKESWDIRGNRTVTDYTPATGGPVTNTQETTQLGWTKKTKLDPAWGAPLTSEDTNGRVITYAYDPLGRLISVWLPGRDTGLSANIVYEYDVLNNAHTVVTSKKLNSTGGYVVSYQFYDSLLRSRQTQDADRSGGAGTVVTDIYYDSAGRVFKTHDEYMAYNSQGQPVTPSKNIFQGTGNIPSFKVRVYDGASREAAEIHKVDGPPASPGGTEKWRTTTAYGGDRTDTTPPAGGISQSTLTDASGNVIELRQYHTGVTAGSDTGFDATRYEYDRKDQLIKMTDALGTKWEYKYDLHGRQIEVSDPDKGTTTTEYNDFGDVRTTTDADNLKLAYTYDSVGRKTSLRNDSETGPLRAEWKYDTLSNGATINGKLVKTIRYDGTDQYIKEHTGYTVDYQPTSVKYTVADADLKGTGSYTYTYTYNVDGSTATTRLPAMGDLAIEQLTHGYNALGKATTLNTSLGTTTYVANLIDGTPGTQYTSLGELAAIHLRNANGSMVDVLRTYETDTRRLKQIWTTRQTAPNGVADVRFEYDDMGNVKKVSDLTAGDHQCFTYDHLRQVKEAWTQGDGNCNAAPSVAGLGGPAKYWQSFAYDATGTRKQQVEHFTAAGERTTDYTVLPGTHKLTGTATADNAGNRNASYTYWPTGATMTRPTSASGTQTLTWDREGHLASGQDSTGTTSFIYDVDGNRLIRKDPTGKTLYLPGQELRFTTSGGTKKCTRYYSHAGETIATRTSSGINWLSSDHHGTAQIAINAVGQAVAARRETPFGEERGSTGTWPSTMDKGFVGGTKDNTGLTHLGAREYDPLIGRFISVDPVIDNKDPLQLHGYSYANNAPITASDPDGLWPKWVKNVANVAVQVVTAPAKAIYDNAGLISAVTGVAALVCSVVPPLQAIAPVLGAISLVTGAIDTAKSCAKGDGLDCAVGVVGMIPGARAITTGIKGARNAKKALDAAEEVYDAAKKARGVNRVFNKVKDQLRRGIKDRRQDLDDWKSALNPFKGGSRLIDDGTKWAGRLGDACLAENSIWEGYKIFTQEPGSWDRHGSRNPWKWQYRQGDYDNTTRHGSVKSLFSRGTTTTTSSSYFQRKMDRLAFL